MDLPAPNQARDRALLAAIVLAQWTFLYNTVDWATSCRARVWLLETAVDRMVPLVTPWVYIYSVAYPCCLAPVFLVTLPRLRTACFAYTFAMVVSLATFVVMPVGMPRPYAPPDAYGASILAITWAVDRPFNCFPSLHVSFAFLSAFVTWTERPRAGGALLVMAVLIGASTMYVKQHWFLDVVAGALLAGLAFRLARQPRIRQLLSDDQSAK